MNKKKIFSLFFPRWSHKLGNNEQTWAWKAGHAGTFSHMLCTEKNKSIHRLGCMHAPNEKSCFHAFVCRSVGAAAAAAGGLLGRVYLATLFWCMAAIFVFWSFLVHFSEINGKNFMSSSWKDFDPKMANEWKQTSCCLKKHDTIQNWHSLMEFKW